jgi:peptidoglycan-associated lipoprotein
MCAFLTRLIGLLRSALTAWFVSLAIAMTASPATATDGATLRLFHGPDDTGSLTVTSIRFLLDGKPLQVQASVGGADVSKPLFAGVVARGVHKLEVEASLEGNAAVFTYTDGYRFKMRSELDLEVLAGESVDIRSNIVSQGGTVPWQDRYRLLLTLSSPDRPARPPPETAVAAAEQPPVAVAAAGAQAGPIAAPPPSPLAAPSAKAPAAGRCALEPVRFSFASIELTAGVQRELDAFAACLGGTTSAVRLEGHCDARGGVEFNQWLADERARAVAAYLKDRGVDAKRISTGYKGKASPLCTEESEPCHARNRRVEAVPRD